MVAKNKAIWTMVARNGNGNGIVDFYTVISDDYEIRQVKPVEVVKALREDPDKFTNLGIGAEGKIVSTNGAMEKYTYFNTDTGKIDGKARPVVLNRAERDGRLIGYTIFTHTGQVKECNVGTAVDIYRSYGISNGKIRHTDSGDIISSINGNFPLRIIEVEKSQSGNVSAQIKFICEARKDGEKGYIRYVGALIAGTSAAKISKVLDKVTESNAKVCSVISQIGGKEARKDVQTMRVSSTAFYSVFELSMVKELREMGVEVAIDKKEDCYGFILSGMNYRDDKSFDEISAKVSTDKAVRIISAPDNMADIEKERFKKFVDDCMSEVVGSLR